MEKVTTLAEFKINRKQPLKHLFISFPKLLAPIAFPGSSTYLRRFIRNSRPLICKHQHCFYFLTTRPYCSSVTRFVNLVAIHPTLPFHTTTLCHWFCIPQRILHLLPAKYTIIIIVCRKPQTWLNYCVPSLFTPSHTLDPFRFGYFYLSSSTHSPFHYYLIFMNCICVV